MHEKEAKSILSAKNGMNLYRGCTHGCIYCDSRSLCYRMDHDFEDVEVKINAPALLTEALRKKRSRCMIGTGSMSDPYLPLEDRYLITQQCLTIIERMGFGATLITKSARVLRDIDLLAAIHSRAKCVVQMTLTTADDALCRILEPHVSPTSERVMALCALRDRGVPTVVWLSPFLPFLNDTEENLRALLAMCFSAGVKGVIYFGTGMTLREGNREYFYRQLDRHFPGLSAQYHKTYGYDYSIQSKNNAALSRILREECDQHGVWHKPDEVFGYLQEYPTGEQLTFF